jgi:hypothetical protein
MNTLLSQASSRPDPAAALQRFTSVNPRRWFTSPVVAVLPLVLTAVAWVTSGAGDVVRIAAPFFVFASAAWLIGLLYARATLMGPERNLVAFYPERLAWFQGQHAQLLERINVESYTREPPADGLLLLVGWLCDRPVAEHFTLRLYERGIRGYNHLGQMTVSLRKSLSIQVTDPDAFEAMLKGWIRPLAGF